MSPEEEAYAEALCRILKAKETGALNLNLRGLSLTQLPQELARLTSLQSLNLSFCRQLSDLSPLATLTSLESLYLSGCEQLSDLSPLTGLTSLQSLSLSYCFGIRRFAPLESLLPTLTRLRLFGCKLDDLPPEVCGENWNENVLYKVRAHYEDLKSGRRIDAEMKVLFLGNGGVGKTQLCRRLCGLEFDPSVPTTHGVQLGEMTLTVMNFPEPVRLNLWDFGGQDIYHGSHALFLQGQAVFLILWTPDLERACSYEEGGVTLRHRPLSYWLDYIREFAGIKGEVLVIQSKCHTRDKRVPHPPAKVDDFCFLRCQEVSAKTGLGLEVVNAFLEEAVRACLIRRPPPPIGAGRRAVRDRLRQMLHEDQALPQTQRQHCLITRKEFDNLCTNVGGVSDKDALLDFLLLNGVVFYRSGLFGGRIVLDQNWALEAIYTLFDRKKILPLLRGCGRFTRKELETLIWAKYTPDQQQVFLEMMEDCGICFRLRKLPHDPTDSDKKEEAEWEYLAPELLPKWSAVQELLFGRLRDDPPHGEATARYAFLHEGVLRGYLSRLGNHAKDAAIYWKYGCWFFEQTTHSQVLIESQWEDAESECGAGTIRLRAWGENAESLIDLLLEALQKLVLGQPPEIKRIIKGEVAISSYAPVEPDISRLGNLEIPTHPELPKKSIPEIFVSYAWGDDSSEEARKRMEVVDRLCETLDKNGWHTLRDNNALRAGELISGFMKRIGLADHVIVVLSDKYLRSPYCMTELHSIYQQSVGEKEEFLRRIIPLMLADAKFGSPENRIQYARHWETRYLNLKSQLDYVSVEDFRLYQDMKKWYVDVGNMLSYINDVLSPHGFDDIVKDDFAALRQMLQRRR